MTWTARLATRDDNDALLALLRDVPMEGDVTVAQDRSPDFFLADALHLGLAETLVAIDDASGDVVACGTTIVRDAWMPDGSRGRAGYLCDLRVRPEHRRARILPGLGRIAFERARDEHGCEPFLTAVIDANARVVGTARRRHPDQPVSRPLTPYHMAAVHAAPRSLARGVERATRDDLDELADFLGQGQRRRAFGYALDRKALEARLALWPGLAIASFLLARSTSGRIVGCCAPWDPSPAKRTRALGYSGAMRATRAAQAALAPLVGMARMPRPGGALRFLAASHFEVEDDDPLVARRLLAAASVGARGSGASFVTAFLPRGSPLQRATRGLVASRVPMTLWLTALGGSRWASEGVDGARPGFEMALA